MINFVKYSFSAFSWCEKGENGGLSKKANTFPLHNLGLDGGKTKMEC